MHACNPNFSTQYEERVSIHTIICKMLLGVFVSTMCNKNILIKTGNIYTKFNSKHSLWCGHV